MKNRNAVTRTAHWSATHPWWALVVWVAFVVGALAVGGHTGTKQATNADLSIGQSALATEIAKSGGLTEQPVEVVLVTAPHGGSLDQQSAARAATDAAGRLKGLSAVQSTGQQVLSTNGQALLVPVTMSGDPDTAADRVQPLVDAVQSAQRGNPGVRVELVGPDTVKAALNTMLNQQVGQATGLSLPITLLVMMFVCGAIIAAGVPVLLGLSSVLAGLGLWGLTSQLVPDPGPVGELVVLMGMAVGVDYSLFYLKRFREERARGKEKIDAVDVAAATSGHSVVVSGTVVILSMGALYLAGNLAFTAMATGSILVVAIAMAASLTLLPALLVIFGKALERPRVPLVWRIQGRGDRARVWSALLRPALRRPVVSLLLSTVALLALAAPALHLQLKATGVDDLPKSMPAMQAEARLTQFFPIQSDTHLVAVEAPAGSAAQVHDALAALVREAGQDPLFTSTPTPEIRTSHGGRYGVVEIGTRFSSSSPQARQSLARLRDDLVPATVGKVPGVKWAVGGSDVAYDVDYRAAVVDRMPWVLGFALALTFLVTALAFRSVVLALVTVVLNMLSAGASFGVLALVFQHTWADTLLDFQSTGRVVAWLPLVLFVILLGLSMDYHVFVVGRIREATRAGLPVREAVERGITRSAGVVTGAAVVMISVFALFASLSFVEMKQLGVGMACAVLLDATLIRIVVLPSVIALLGERTWWPSRPAAQPGDAPETEAETETAAERGEPVGAAGLLVAEDVG
ncbi:MMPL family transporter [Streptacidiphilus melanogenes]|uniref:MMPL family transporter n=1 Tax=Streptacidiphilus melanogenes TaxID=411235 RepID=UPI0005AB9242|nr:MMPL family transporter [Streptacidiphilus melanogenes]